jgi:deazaflavin-dependent oxidoreductase (nitroreductase family)
MRLPRAQKAALAVTQITPTLAFGRVNLLLRQVQDADVDDHAVQPRTRKYRALKVMLWGSNRVLRWQLRHGLAPRAFALLETTGRGSGRPRQTCVGNGLIGDTFWLVAAHGLQADWVRNLAKEPGVRVLVGRRWRSGTASLMPDDDTEQRSRTLPYQWDAAVGRSMATTPVTVRIDLQQINDPDAP